MNASYLRKGQGNSDSAYYAQSCGRWPLTRAVKIIAEQIKPYYKIPQRIIREWLEEIGSCEWHHVGKYATPCDYYDTEDVLDALFGRAEGYWDINLKGDVIYMNDNSFMDYCGRIGH